MPLHLLPTNWPQWEINNVGLVFIHGLDYLGTVLSKDNGKEHASARIKSSNRAYFSLQGAGLCKSGLAPFMARLL